MDVLRWLKELHKERELLEKAIRRLELMLDAAKSAETRQRGKRGRKPGMSNEERKEISERMRRYWAQRRNHRGVAQLQEGETPPVEDSTMSGDKEAL